MITESPEDRGCERVICLYANKLLNTPNLHLKIKGNFYSRRLRLETKIKHTYISRSYANKEVYTGFYTLMIDC